MKEASSRDCSAFLGANSPIDLTTMVFGFCPAGSTKSRPFPFSNVLFFLADVHNLRRPQPFAHHDGKASGINP